MVWDHLLLKVGAVMDVQPAKAISAIVSTHFTIGWTDWGGLVLRSFPIAGYILQCHDRGHDCISKTCSNHSLMVVSIAFKALGSTFWSPLEPFSLVHLIECRSKSFWRWCLASFLGPTVIEEPILLLCRSGVRSDYPFMLQGEFAFLLFLATPPQLFKRVHRSWFQAYVPVSSYSLQSRAEGLTKNGIGGSMKEHCHLKAR